MNNKRITYAIVSIYLLTVVIIGQSLVFDNTHSVFTEMFWPYQDSLEAYEIEIQYLSENGWSALNNTDLFWIPDLWETYTTTEKNLILDFSRNGGKVLIWWHHCSNEMNIKLNDLLLYPGWDLSMSVSDLDLRGPEYIWCIRHIIPFTERIDSVKLQAPTKIECGHNIYPFMLLDSSCTIPVAAISFPFLSEGNCSSFVVLITGADWFVTAYCDSLWSHPADNRRFALNIIYAMLGVPGYEFDPCAFADSMLVPKIDTASLCHRTPNPFTPNGDGINDEAKFEFPGLGEVPGTIKIFTLGNLRVRTIEVPSGAGAKQQAIWDGKDDTGTPMREGIYLYTIRAEGRIKCQGTVTLAR